MTGRSYRLTYTPEARADLVKLGEPLTRTITSAVLAEVAPEPYGGLSIERPLGGGSWDRVALVAMAAVRYIVSDDGVEPPTITVLRVINRGAV
ncbi:hypothetical protein [Streptomyces sp. UNOC14_S4]|uniref:hypothetical protein n=1 Tax=Streptomyces sp. UNOC14_S4 TaxID=2872340 RepID=UPI001E5A020B|nr:hypothetical protein [Streptomyces sp. UNOC14_S4]MCC3769156.1 hypothetical protein [Streptomyces sp. UNOC14_S4]